MISDNVVSGTARRGARALIAGALACVALLAAGAVAQAQEARTSKEPVDFVFDVRAASASFAPITGKPGMYRLVLRGVPGHVGVHELDRARSKHQFPTAHMIRYWTAYGDASGQFESDPPYAVVRGSGDQQGDAVVVLLREGSRKGSTLTFEAEIETRSQVLRLLKSKIAKTIEREIGALTHVTKPEAMKDVVVHIDVPKTIAHPDQAAAKSMLRTARPAVRDMSCNGVYSSQLVQCWEALSCDNIVYAGAPDGPLVYDGVGAATLGGWWFLPQGVALLPYDRDRCLAYFDFGRYYGVNWRDAVTYYATDNCSYFLAKWSAYGRCY